MQWPFLSSSEVYMFTLQYDLSQPELSASFISIAKKLSYRVYLPLTILFGILLFFMLSMTSMLTTSSRFIFLIVYSFVLIFFFMFLFILFSLPSRYRAETKNSKPQQVTFFNEEILIQSESSENTYSYHFYDRFRIKDQWLILYVRRSHQKEVAKSYPGNPTNIMYQLISLHTLSPSLIADFSHFLANRIHK